MVCEDGIAFVQRAKYELVKWKMALNQTIIMFCNILYISLSLMKQFLKLINKDILKKTLSTEYVFSNSLLYYVSGEVLLFPSNE